MYDFLNAIGGMGFAILGAALTVGLCCVGSAKGTGLVGEAAAGLVSEDPDKSTKCLILQVLPGTQGLYGFVALFIVLLQVGLMSGTPVDLTLTQGMSFFAACIPTAIGGRRLTRGHARAGAPGMPAPQAHRQATRPRACVPPSRPAPAPWFRCRLNKSAREQRRPRTKYPWENAPRAGRKIHPDGGRSASRRS